MSFERLPSHPSNTSGINYNNGLNNTSAPPQYNQYMNAGHPYNPQAVLNQVNQTQNQLFNQGNPLQNPNSINNFNQQQFNPNAAQNPHAMINQGNLNSGNNPHNLGGSNKKHLSQADSSGSLVEPNININKANNGYGNMPTIGTDSINVNVQGHEINKHNLAVSPQNGGGVLESVTYPYGGNQAHHKHKTSHEKLPQNTSMNQLQVGMESPIQDPKFHPNGNVPGMANANLNAHNLSNSNNIGNALGMPNANGNFNGNGHGNINPNQGLNIQSANLNGALNGNMNPNQGLNAQSANLNGLNGAVNGNINPNQALNSQSPGLNGALHGNMNGNQALNTQTAIQAANQVSNGEVPSANGLVHAAPNSMQANAANLNFTNPGKGNKPVISSQEDCCCTVM